MGAGRRGKSLAKAVRFLVCLLALAGMSFSQTSSTPSAPAPAMAQAPDTPPPQDDQSGGFVFKKEVEEVILHAVVVDDQNRRAAPRSRARLGDWEYTEKR